MGTGKHFLFFVISALSALIIVETASAQDRGYDSRNCGFDLDGDGIVGEAQDDCNICDGVTKDPDGDGKNEDLIYVNCSSGNDSSSCGAPGSPCRTIQHAWSSRADGPGDGAEDIICFTGTCKTLSDFSIPRSGVGSGGDNGNWYNESAATGNQVRSFRYPANPTMLVGWDKDNDGRYPPADTDDTSVLDGGANQLKRALNFSKIPSYVELAHFSVRDYGRYSSGAGSQGFLRIGSTEKSGVLSGVRVHDVILSGINQSRTEASSTIAINLFGNNAHMKWIAFENLKANNIGSWFIRGGVGTQGEDIGPFRFQNISLTMYPAKGGGHAMKMWGLNRGVEVLDNHFDGNPRAWNPRDLKTMNAFMISTCSQDWDLINNEMIDFRGGLWVSSKSPIECTKRPVNDIRFERNIFRNTFGWEGVAPILVHQAFLEPIDDLTCSKNTEILDYVVANNFLSSTTGYKACYIDSDGNNCRRDEGTAMFVNNTCYGKLARSGMAAIQIGKDPSSQKAPQNRQRNYVVWNNIVGGIESGDPSKTNIQVQPAPANWSAGNNVYDPSGDFYWKTSKITGLSQWRQSSNGDAQATMCAPSFVAPSNGDFHLKSTDSCAIGRAESMPTIISVDLDAGERPKSSAWDAGADQQGVEGEAGSGGGGDGGGDPVPPAPSGLSAPKLQEVVPLPN